MMDKQILLSILLATMLSACGKVGPLSLPEDKLDKSIITYPCDKVCLEKLEKEKQRQESVILQTD